MRASKLLHTIRHITYRSAEDEDIWTRGWQPVSIHATDGFRLGARALRPRGKSHGVVIVTAATGLRQGRYRAYGEYLAARGWAVVTFDYRGIGDSRPASLRGFHARAHDWGSKDLAGVLHWADREFKGEKIVVVGHSVGGQVVAFADNNHRIDALVAIATPHGLWRYWDGLEKYGAYLYWRLIPVGVAVFGYLPLRFAACEPIPANAALDLARWGLNAHFPDEGGRSLASGFRRIDAPILCMSFADDRVLAPSRAVDALMSLFCGSKSIQQRHVTPDELGVPVLGHSGFFDARIGSSLWQETEDWLRRA